MTSLTEPKGSYGPVSSLVALGKIMEKQIFSVMYEEVIDSQVFIGMFGAPLSQFGYESLCMCGWMICWWPYLLDVGGPLKRKMHE